MKKVLFVALAATVVALLFYISFAPQACAWGPGGCRPRPRPIPKIPPKPNPQPKPNSPKPNTPKPDEPAPPESIDWKEVKDAGLPNDAIRKTKLWKHFADMSDTDMSDLEATKPVMIYFYTSYEETSDKKILNMIRRCELMEKNIFSSEEVRKASTLFHCLWCNFKEMSKQLKKKYKLTVVPKVLFFDVKGRRVWQLTSTKAKPDGVAKKMLKLASDSKRLLKAMKNK